MASIFCIKNNAQLLIFLVSKLTERSVSDQLLFHMSSNGLYLALQSSYRQHNGIDTALLEVKDDIYMNMNKGYVT